MRPRGLFITFEGVEGSGKSTQIRALAVRLSQRGVRVQVTREPGGTPDAERLRRLLLSRGGRWTPLAELLLVNAARAAHVEEVVRPALRRGAWVLCDRFTDATLAYQGYGRGLPLPLARRINRLATRGLSPDRTLVLDLPSRRALGRARRRAGVSSRFEDEPDSFHRRVRAGYRRLARREPGRFRWVPAAGARRAVAERVWLAIEDLVAGAALRRRARR